MFLEKTCLRAAQVVVNCFSLPTAPQPIRGQLLLLVLVFFGTASHCELIAALLHPGSGSPDFEEEHFAASSTQYTWRSSSVIAKLSAGGMVALHQPNGLVVTMSFPGDNPLAKPCGENRLPRKTLHYVGRQESWREDAHFERVRYSQIYPGINVVFVTNAGRLEYNFELGPYAEAKSIRVRYAGARLSLDSLGDLEIHTPAGTILQRRPRAYQEQGTARLAIACRYRLLRRDEVTLELGFYDRRAALFIDPVLVFSTYAGGAGFDAIYAMAVDSSGNLYLAGETGSEGLWNGLLPARSSHVAFVTKLNSTASRVFYTVYVGGGGGDSGRAIALDGSGNAYITGVTDSTDFPTTPGAYSRGASVFPNTFVAKLNSLGQLVYSTYLGSTGPNSGFAIALDSSGDAYIAGQTASTSFPVTAGAFRTAYQGGASDCFVSKLNAAGSALIYSTYLGGTGLDMCTGIALDSSGDAYVTGTTFSLNFPVQAAYQGALLGAASAFVTAINPTGTALLYSTYLGGSEIDSGNAIALDSSGNAYVTGATDSFDFPVTAGAPQTALNGTYNAFVSKLSTGGSLIYSTFLGGSATDTGTSIAVDPAGRVVVGGFTSSSNFPTVGAIQSTNAGGVDAFASVLDPLGATVLFASYFGGAGGDQGYAVGVLPGGSFYLAGSTASSNLSTLAAIQPTLHTPPDGFLLEVSGIGGSATSFLTGYALNSPALRNDFTGWVGMQIKTGATALTIASLGRICVAGNSGTHTVQVVNTSTGVAVGAAQVNMAGCSAGQFAYTALSPAITLQANTVYYLASQEVTGGDQWYNDGTVSSTSVASVSNGIFSYNDAAWMQAPSGLQSASYVPPNFTYLSSGAGTVTVNVQTNPSGATFSVDGVPYSTPQVFQWTPGSAHTLATTSPQSGGTGTQYVWSSWSDSGALSHTVSPSSNIGYTATFTTQYLLTTGVSPPSGGTITENPLSATGYYTSGTGVQVTAAASSGFTFLDWSGALSGSTVQQTLTMSAPQSVTANFQSNGSGGATSFLTGYALNSPPLRNDFSGWVGMQITIGASPLTIASLGRVCVAGNSGTHTVQIVNAASGTVVGSAQVNMAGCTAGQFAYSSLSAGVILQANTAYFLATQEIAGGDVWYNDGTVTSTSAATVNNGIFSYNDTAWNAAPTGLSSASYVPPNFTYLPLSGGASAFVTGYALNSPALRNDFTGWVGMQIKAGAGPLTVVSLGRICVAGNSGTHTVQIVNATNGAVIGSAQVNMAGCTAGQFTYTMLSPALTLQGNSSYFLASQEIAGGDAWYNDGTISSTTIAAVTNAIFSYNDTAWAAPSGTPNTSYVPPNFTYTGP